MLSGNNEEILSDASDVEGKEIEENRQYIGSDGVHSDDSEEETSEEKRLRLAKKYLEEIERQGKKPLLILDICIMKEQTFLSPEPHYMYNKSFKFYSLKPFRKRKARRAF